MVEIGSGKVGDAVVTERVSETGIDDVAKARSSIGRPLPEWFGDFGLVIDGFPSRICPQGLAECRGFPGTAGPFENGGIAQLHVDFNQYQSTENESLLAPSLGYEKPLRGFVMR